MESMTMKKREWVYLQNPKDYGIECDLCSGDNIDWSEFDKLIWCYDCEKDTEGTKGLLDGTPVPVQTCRLMGITFDQLNLVTGEVRVLEESYNGNYIGQTQVKKS
jgi:hypothetical protein